MLRRALVPLLSAAAIWAGHVPAARAASCDICDGTTPCGSGESCVGGLPETSNGRCLAPCPNPSAPFGGCPTDFTCIPLTSGARVCLPRSEDCTNLQSYTEVPFGQQCETQSCEAGSICTGICTTECTGSPGQGSCPGGYVCGRFGSAANPVFFCGPEAREAETCQPGGVCPVGYCLITQQGQPGTCFRDCASTRTCGSGQSCMDVMLQSGSTISVCNPPMMGSGGDAGVVPPRDSGVTPPRDAGFRDATSSPDFGFPNEDAGFPEEDTGVGPPRDSGQPPRDTGVGPGVDTGAGPGVDTGVVGPGMDTGVVVGPDGAVIGADAGSGGRDATSSSTTTGRRGGGAPAARTGGCGCSASDPGMSGKDGVLSGGLILLAGLAISGRRRRSSR